MEDVQRISFTFFASFYHSMRDLPPADRLKLYDAIVEYGLFGVVPDLSGVPRALFELMRPPIDSSNRRREAQLARPKEKQGGAPIGNRNARKFPLQENDLKTTLKQPDKETEREREKEVESEADEEKKEAPPKLCFGEKVIEEETEKEKKAAAVLGFDPFAIARNALYGDRSVPSSPETDMETRKQEQIAAVLGWRS